MAISTNYSFSFYYLYPTFWKKKSKPTQTGRVSIFLLQVPIVGYWILPLNCKFYTLGIPVLRVESWDSLPSYLPTIYSY